MLSTQSDILKTVRYLLVAGHPCRRSIAKLQFGIKRYIALQQFKVQSRQLSLEHDRSSTSTIFLLLEVLIVQARQKTSTIKVSIASKLDAERGATLKVRTP